MKNKKMRSRHYGAFPYITKDIVDSMVNKSYNEKGSVYVVSKEKNGKELLKNNILSEINNREIEWNTADVILDFKKYKITDYVEQISSRKFILKNENKFYIDINKNNIDKEKRNSRVTISSLAISLFTSLLSVIFIIFNKSYNVVSYSATYLIAALTIIFFILLLSGIAVWVNVRKDKGKKVTGKIIILAHCPSGIEFNDIEILEQHFSNDKNLLLVFFLSEYPENIVEKSFLYNLDDEKALHPEKDKQSYLNILKRELKFINPNKTNLKENVLKHFVGYSGTNLKFEMEKYFWKLALQESLSSKERTYPINKLNYPIHKLKSLIWFINKLEQIEQQYSKRFDDGWKKAEFELMIEESLLEVNLWKEEVIKFYCKSKIKNKTNDFIAWEIIATESWIKGTDMNSSAYSDFLANIHKISILNKSEENKDLFKFGRCAIVDNIGEFIKIIMKKDIFNFEEKYRQIWLIIASIKKLHKCDSCNLTLFYKGSKNCLKKENHQFSLKESEDASIKNKTNLMGVIRKFEIKRMNTEFIEELIDKKFREWINKPGVLDYLIKVAEQNNDKKDSNKKDYVKEDLLILQKNIISERKS